MSDEFWWVDFILGKEGKIEVRKIINQLNEVSRADLVCPDIDDIFRAFTFLNETKVVIIGNEPYSGRDQANGYSFAVRRGSPLPPTLKNIFKEVTDDVGECHADKTLSHWAKQGVMLLNTTLTVTTYEPGSHSELGWIKITSKVIEYLSSTRDNLVFILWGAQNQKMSKYIENYDKHLVIKSSHPSPFFANKGFFGSKPFSRTNEYLVQHGKELIEW